MRDAWDKACHGLAPSALRKNIDKTRTYLPLVHIRSQPGIQFHHKNLPIRKFQVEKRFIGFRRGKAGYKGN